MSVNSAAGISSGLYNLVNNPVTNAAHLSSTANSLDTLQDRNGSSAPNSQFSYQNNARPSQNQGGAYSRTMHRARDTTATSSSRTQTITVNNTSENQESQDRDSQLVGYLNLVGQEDVRDQARISRPGIRWAEDTVDNEHMNKKKSKICCIYRKPRAWDESDTDESSSDCDSDGDGPNEYEKAPKYKPKGCRHNHNH